MGELAKSLRKGKGLNQSELAELCGVHSVTISNWETGKKAPEANNVNKLAEVLGVTTDYLMGRTNDPLPAQDIKKEAPSQTAGSLKENHLDNLESNLESRPLKTVMIPVYAESEICLSRWNHHRRGPGSRLVSRDRPRCRYLQPA